MVHKTPQSRVLFGRANVGLLLSLLVTLLVLVVTPFVNHPQPVQAATTSSTINFQARLLQNSGAVVPDGNYHVEFKLYDTVASGGSAQGVCSLNSSTDDCWWVETRTTGNLVRVVNGYLTVNLGSVTAFGASIPWDRELWLTMNIGGTSGPSWDGEMSPRIKLTAVPYAFRAAQLVSHNGTQTGTLAFGSVTNSPALTLPNETGTVCTNAATGACTATGGFVQLQSATPGTQQTGNLNISGTGILGTQLQTPAILAPAGLTIQATGTNTLVVNTVGAGTLSLGTSTTTTIALGNTGTTVLTVEGSSAAGGIIIGNGATNHGIQIGTSSSGDNDIIIGSTNSGSTLSLEGGTAANSIAIGNAATAHNIAIGNASGANNTVVGIGSGTTGGSNTSVITIGSANAANSTLLLQGGNNTGAVSIQAATSGTISIGTTNNNPINIGSTSTNSQINIGQATGANSNTIAIGATIGNTGTQTINLGYNSSPTAGSTTNVNIGSTIAGTTAVQGATTVTNRTSGSADTLVVSNNTSTGTIAKFLDGGSATPVLQIADGGGTTFTNQTNSATAFQIQNATNADQLFTVDTTARGAGGGNLIKIGNSTAVTDVDTTVLKLDSNAGVLATNLAALNGGLYYNSSLGRTQVIEGSAVKTLCNLTDLACGPSTTTLQNAYDNDANGGDAIIPLTSADGGIIIRNPSSSGSGSTYNLVIDQLATGANGGLSIQSAGTSNLLLITDTTSTARDVLTIADTGITTFRNQTDSTAAFKVQNAAGTNILNTDTTNQRVVIGSNQTNSTGQLFLAGFANPVQVGQTQGTVPNTSLQDPVSLVVQGRYAYVTDATRAALAIFDVSNPASPSQLSETRGFVPGTSLLGARGIAVIGRYAYVSVASRASLAVIDVSNPLAPVQVGETRGTIPGTSLDGAQFITLAGKYAYVTASTRASLAIIDISNPVAPVQVGETRGTAPGTSLGNAQKLVVVGKYAYIASQSDTALIIVDVSNPTGPTQVGRVVGSILNPVGVAVVGRYAYVTDKNDDSLIIFDVSNPASPAQVGRTQGTVPNTSLDQTHDIAIAGRYAYMTSFAHNSVAVVDISNPTSPTMVGETQGTVPNTSLNGARGIGVDGRYAYVTTQSNDSLVILDLGGTYSTSIESGSVDTTDLRTNTLSVQQYATFNSGLQAAGGVQITGNLGVNGSSTFASDTTNNTSGSKIGFQIQDANAGQILNVNTTSLMNLLANGSFENTSGGSTVPGWAAEGTGTLTISNSQAYFNTYSLSIASGGSNNGGAKHKIMLKPNTTYTISAYARLSSGSMSTFAMGYNIGSPTDCISGQTLSTSAWTRFTCSFTTTSTTDPTYYVYVRDTSNTHTFFIDGVLLQQGSSATPYVEPPSPNLITNHSLESNTNGWLATANAGSSMGVSTDVAYSGKQSLKFALSTATSNDKIYYPIPLLANTTYTFSVYARMLANSRTDMSLGHQLTSGAGEITTGTGCAANTVDSANAYWQRYTCTFTTANATPDATTYVFVKFTTSGLARTVYFDGFQLETASAATPYYDTQNNLQVDTLTSNITINGSQNGDISPWKRSANDLPAVRGFHGSVVANGYVYVLGGYDGGSTYSTVYYAKLNSDGTTGAWQTNANALPGNRSGSSFSVTANGYIYVIGGTNGGAAQATIFYAKLNNDGSTGAWQTNVNSLILSRNANTVAVLKGYVYVFNGASGGAGENIAWYAKLNADGSTGPWQATTVVPGVGLNNGATVVANGYVYVIGGDRFGMFDTVYYAKPNADGSISSWSTNANTLPAARAYHSSVVLNGYIYVIGGQTNGGAAQTTTYYAKINSDGSTGAWQTSAYPTPKAIYAQDSVVANGYIYNIGGNDGGSYRPTVYYTSTARIQAFGSLDLVGLSGQNLAEGNTGGQLTAGNTSIVGTLNVQDQASFSQSVSIQGDLNAYSHVNVPGFNNPVQVGETQGTTPGTSLDGAQTVAVQGRYAYVITGSLGSRNSLAILDISKPSSPVMLSEITGLVTNGNTTLVPTNIAVAGRYAYVTAGSGNALIVIDISNPLAPIKVGETRGWIPGTSLNVASDVAISGRYAYVPNDTRDSLAIIDISNPTAPVQVGETQGTTPGTSLDGANAVAISGRYAYVTNGFSGSRQSLAIIDISNPTSPVQVGETQGTTPGTSLDGANAVAISGRYAYVTTTNRNSLAVIDISNPTAPVQVGETRGTTPGTSLNTPKEISIQGHYAYIAVLSNKTLAVIDISNPTAPIQIGETGGTTPGTSLNGADGLAISGRYAYVANITRDSLAILDLGGTYSTSIESGSVDTTDLRTNTLSVQQYATFNSGLQASGGVQITGNLGVQGPATFTSDTTNNTSGSKIGFQIQDANAGQILNVNTTSLMNLLSNGSFENGNAVTAVPGWAKISGPETMAVSTSQSYYGTSSLSTTTSGVANQGAKYTFQFKPNTTYTLSLYARLASGSFNLQIGGFSNGGVAGSCNTALSTTVWTRLNCTFTTSSTTTASDYIFARNQFTSTPTYFIDGVQLQEGGSYTPYVEPPSPNLITNHSLESNTNGFSLRGTAVSIAPSADTAYSGKQSLKLTLSAAGTTDGVNYSIPLLATTNYSFSFYARLLTGSTTDMNVGRRENGSDTDITGCTAQTLSNSTWTRYTCSWTTGTTVDSNTSLYVRFTTSASNRVIYLDGFQLETAAAATPYYDTQNNLNVDTSTSNITINGSQNGDIQPWRRNATTLGASVAGGGTVIANGYIYYIGGATNVGQTTFSTAVYYAKLNADGSVGTFNTTTALPVNRNGFTTVALNGFVYVIGGWDNSSTKDTVYYARINQDGTLGNWRLNPVVLPQTRREHTGFTYNGFIYVIAGIDSITSRSSYFVKPNIDGSLPSWTQTTDTPSPGRTQNHNSTVAVNGYTYLIAGQNSGNQSQVYYTSISSSGALGTWLSTTSIPSTDSAGAIAAANGYLYYMKSNGTVYYGKVNSDGTVSYWNTSVNSRPQGSRRFVTSASSNGYIYNLGGDDGGATLTNSVTYTSTARIQAFGSLDLVGLSGQNLNEGNSGGSLTAGNTSIVGSLNVQDQASFAQSVAVSGDLNAFSHVNVPGFNNPVEVAETQGPVPNTTFGQANGVAVQGKYAYVVSKSSRLVVEDISNPASPVWIGEATGTSLSGADTVVVQGKYAYVTASSNNSLAIVDISNPFAPTVVGETKGPNPGDSLNSPTGLAVQGRYAYVASNQSTKLTVVDISNPYKPTVVSMLNDATIFNNILRVVAQGRYVYTTNYNRHSLAIVDVSNPLSPTIVGEYQDNTRLTGAWGLSVSGRYAYVTSETSNYVTIIDVKNPASPVLAGSINDGSTLLNGTENNVLVGHYLYVTCIARDSVAVIDVSNPAVPVQVGETRGWTANTSLDNAQDIAISGRYAYVAVWGSHRLTILDLGGTYSTGIEAGSVDATNVRAGSFTATANASFGSGVQISGGLEVAGGVGLRGNLTLQADSSATTSVLHVNTISNNMNLIVNGDFEQNVNGWGSQGAPAAGPTYNDASTNSAFGRASLTFGTNAADQGVMYNYPFTPSGTYVVTFWAKLASGSQGFKVGSNENGTAADDCTTFTFTTTWTQFQCTLAIGATVGTASNFYIRQNGAGTQTVYIDGVSMTSGSATNIPQFLPTAENLSVESVNDNITINGVNSGEVQPWQQNSTSLGATTPGDTTANKVVARQGAASVVSNGFMYVVGGYDGTNVLNSILYAKMNADGSLGNWNCQGTNVATSCGTAATAINANSLPGSRQLLAATVANGYIYAIGGVDGTPTAQSTIYYAKLNGDGSTGTWQTNAYGVGQNVTTAAAARVALSVVVRDGFIYTLGGCSDSSANCATPITTTNYAKLYADGGIGPWTTTTVLPAARGMGSATIANGFVYYLGGFNSTAQTAVYAAPINTDGTIGSWNSGITPPVLLANRTQQTTVVANGYIYVIGGCNALTTGSCTNAAATTSTVYYAKLNPTNGNLGAWNTGANALPAPRGGQSTTIANGYIYVLGGYDGAARAANVFYSSTSRVLVGGSLDLVGLSGGSLSDYSGAGALTAGNGRFIGDLKVDGFADFNNGISVDSAININAISANSGQTVFNINNTNSNSIFSIRHMSTNFGSLVSAGAFMAKNSYWAEEYNIAQQGNVAMTLSAAQFACAWARGDTGGHVTQAPVTCSSTADSNSGQGGMTISANLQAATTDACTPSQPAGANGLETITATAVNTAAHSASCSEYPTGGVTGASSNFLTATNLPVMTMKVRPSTLASDNGIRVFAGMWSGGKAPAAGTLPGTAASTWGVYFTNCSATTPTCANTTLRGWVVNASTTLVGSVSCPTQLSTTNYAYLRIEFRTATEVHFYADVNTADGINEVECGTGVSSGSINAGAMTPFVQAVNSVNATGATTVLDVDYLRTWQDDNVDMSTVEVSPGSTNTGSGQDGEDLQTLPPLSPESADPNVLGSFFNFNAATSEDSVFNHNVYIKGTLYVDKIRANEIEGLEVFTDKLSSLQAELAARAAENGEGSNSEENSDDTSNVPLGAPGLNLSGLVLGATTVNFDLNVNGALTIGGDANFHGNVFFYKLVTFVEKTVFNNDITLKGHLITDGANPDTTLLPAAGLTASNDPNANLASVAIDGNDTNGLISITLGDNATPGELVKVSFKRPYTKAPRLILAPYDGTTAQNKYYVDSNTDSFVIHIMNAQPAGTELKFNYWVAH